MQDAKFLHIQNVLLKSVALFEKRELSLFELKDRVGYFTSELSKTALNQGEFLTTLSKTISEISKISFAKGILIISLIFFNSFLQIFLSIFRPIVPTVHKILLYARIKKALWSLKPTKEGIRILCILPSLSFGGAEKVLWQIVLGLKNKGYHFYFLARRKENNSWCQNFLHSFEGSILLPARKKDYRRKEEEIYAFLKSTIDYLKIDILFTSDAPGLYFNSIPKIKSEFPHLKIIDLLHAEDYGGFETKYLWLVPYFHHRIFVSDRLKDIVCALYKNNNIDPLFSSRLSVVHNGHDLNFFTSSSDLDRKFRQDHQLDESTKIISYIGRLSDEKRPWLFVEIARELIQTNKRRDLKFVIAGDGQDGEKVKKLIKTYQLEKYFVLLGTVEKETIKELLSSSFAVLIVSRMEGPSLVAGESLAMGVPVISANVGSIGDVVHHGINGFLVDAGAYLIKESVTVLERLLDTPEEYQRIVNNTRSSLVEKFALTSMVNGYQKNFDNTLIDSSTSLEARI